MSYKENSIIVSLTSSLLILGYYLVSWLRMYQTEGLNSDRVFRLWIIVIVATIVLNILGNILTSILLNILHAIKTRTDEEVRFVEDERDRLIDLRGTKVAYFVSSIGVFLSMLTFAFGQPPLVMFSLLILSGLVAQIISDISRLVLYRRGV